MNQNVCIVILIGLPASGKTTFANLFCENVMGKGMCGSHYHVVHVCYDDLISLEEASASWKDARKNLLHKVDRLVSSNVTTVPSQSYKCCLEEGINSSNGNTIKTLILIDDNMYYRSMRYEFYQLARIHTLSFCQLYFDCSVEMAVKNNLKRETKFKVLDDVIMRMSFKLEPPDPEHNSWEKFSMTLPSCTYNIEVQCSVLQLIDQSLNEVVMPKKSFEDQEASRAECLANILHQIDILSRKLVGQIMMQKCKEGLCKQELSRISLHLNSKRQSLLGKIKVGEIQCPEQIRLQFVCNNSPIPESILQDWVADIFGSL